MPRRHGFAAETGDWHGSYAFSMCFKSFWLKASNRKYQVRERNPLRVALWNRHVVKQKLDYIHNNPNAAGLGDFLEEYYYYSSAEF